MTVPVSPSPGTQPAPMAPAAELLEIRSLHTSFATSDGTLRAVDGIDLAVRAGETLALVGESGSGKSVTALSILRLVPAPGRTVSGSIRLSGRELTTLSEREMRAVRGREIGLVFQDPASALDPLMRVGAQIGEALRAHRELAPALGRKLDRVRARERAVELCARVGFPDPARAVDLFPHELSGGMRQRALIAIAIACDPALLVADEPTTALDGMLQAGVLALLRELRRSSGMGMLLVTHDLGIVAENAERTAVMYAGRIVEEGATRDLLARPRHPYTLMLLRSLPAFAARGARLAQVPGSPPDAYERPSGCRFRTRCPLARDLCAEVEPELVRVGDAADAPGHRSACHFADEVEPP